LQINIVWRLPAVEVVVGMIAYAVAIFHQAIEQFRMFFYIFANTEECGLDVVVF